MRHQFAHGQGCSSALDTAYGEDLPRDPVQVLRVRSDYPHQEIGLATQAEDLHDLGDVGQRLRDLGQLVLIDLRGDDRRERLAQRFRADPPFEGAQYAA